MSTFIAHVQPCRSHGSLPFADIKRHSIRADTALGRFYQSQGRTPMVSLKRMSLPGSELFARPSNSQLRQRCQQRTLQRTPRCGARLLTQNALKPLTRFPCRLIYLVECPCQIFRKYVDLNPHGLQKKGLGEELDEYVEFGETRITRDSLVDIGKPC